MLMKAKRWFISIVLVLVLLVGVRCNSTSDETGTEPEVQEQPFIEHSIDSNFDGIHCIKVIELNFDGVLDVIGSSWKMNQLAYWTGQDLANDQWEKTMVTDQLIVATNVRGRDMDRDGDIDIVAVGKDPGELAIFLNDNFFWTRQVVKPNFEGGTALAVIDLDGDGDDDIVAGASALGNLSWWENR
jgi:hypothetical protein